MKLVPRTRQYFSTWHHDFDEFFLLFLWFYTIFFQVSLVHDFCFFGQKSCHFGQKWYRLFHHNHLTNGICLEKRIHDFVFFCIENYSSNETLTTFQLWVHSHLTHNWRLAPKTAFYANARASACSTASLLSSALSSQRTIHMHSFVESNECSSMIVIKIA